MTIRTTLHVFAACTLLFAAAAPLALAADLTDVGYLDQAALGSLPPFVKANAQVASYKAQLDQQYAARMRSAHTDAQRQSITAEFQQKFIDKQREVLGPLFTRAQTAIAQVSANKNLSIIVDKSIVIYGGQNITKSVIDLFNSPGAVVPPTNTPPPSEIGFVDQNQLDSTPKIKQANDTFLKFAANARTQAMKQMQGAKKNVKQQQKIFQDYQNSLSSEQNKTLKPLADQERAIMAQVAGRKHLILVVDRTDVIYGGTDITTDVQNALK